jgi:uncharacterized membrane protein
MFEEEENTEADDSVGDALTTYVCIIAAIIVIGSLYIGLADLTFGTQIATAITYSGVVYWMVFYKTRWFKTAFSFQDECVKEKLPHLLGIHAGFLLLTLSIQTALLTVRSHLPSYWFIEKGPKHSSLYFNALFLPSILIGLVQIWISRGILSRSVTAKTKKSATGNEN